MTDNNTLWSITLGDLLHKQACDHPDHLFVKYRECDYERTYLEFDEEVSRIAKGFLALGIQKGDHIAIWAPNYPQWLLTLFASARIGAVLVTVNTSYKVFEAEYLLRQSDTKLLVMNDGGKDVSYVDIIREICPEIGRCDPHNLSTEKLPFLKGVVTIDETHHEGMMHWNEIENFGKTISDEELNAAKAACDPHDVVNMQYTSGTTGFPKGVMLTHYNIINNGKCIGDCMKFTPDDKLCICVPFFHCFGLVLAVMASVTHASSIVPIYFYRPLVVMEAIHHEKCTAVHGVPTMFIAMLEHPQFDCFDFSHMRTGIMAGSPCPIQVMRQVVEKMHMPEITITYGQTEASPATTMSRTDDSLELRVSTVGRSMPFVETKIVDPETGETLPPNVPGEFCSRGYNTMKGYYKMPEATAQAIDAEGWLHSGDLAMVDENGYYKITGRIKDMIIRGGENIYPKEIEELLYTHPDISDVQVVGVPSKQYGEEVMACCIQRERGKLSEEKVKDFVRERMARHKVPKYVMFLDAFPMTASGKIQKFKLREMGVEHLSLQADAAIETA